MNDIKVFFYGFISGIIFTVILYGIYWISSYTNESRVYSVRKSVNDYAEGLANVTEGITDVSGHIRNAENAITEALGILNNAKEKTNK